MSTAENNPLGDYLDALLAPPEDPAADWDALLKQAVEPFAEQPEKQVQLKQQDQTDQQDDSDNNEQPKTAVFSASTLAPGRAPVLCVAEQELPLAGRYSYFLNTLMLLKQLPASRLRLCVLQHCDQTLASLGDDQNSQTLPLWITTFSRAERALSHE